MKLIQIPNTLLHELNVLVDEQYNRIKNLQTDITILQSRNTLLCDSLLHYFNKDQKRRTRASVMLRDYGSHQHLGCECNCRYG